MELKLKLCEGNHFPLIGILIKGEGVEHWLKEIQYMGFSLDQVNAFAIPGNVPNSVWGCLIEFTKTHKVDTGRNTFCQCINNLLFIPERTVLFPKISNEEVEKLTGGKKHIFHPEIGLAALEDQIDWHEVVSIKESLHKKIIQPSLSVFVPKQIKSFQIKPVKLEEMLQQMDEKLFPKREKFAGMPVTEIFF